MMNMADSLHKPKAYAALLFAIATWGLSPMFIRKLALATGPADSIAIRMCSVAIICMPLLAIAGWRVERKDIPNLLMSGVVGMFGYFLGTIFGFSHVSSGVGGMIMATQPLVIALMAAAFGTEKLSLAVLLGMGVSFLGTLLLFSGSQSSTNSGTELLIGGAMVFASGIAWAIYVIYSKPLIQKYGTFKISAWSLFLCAPPALLFASSTTWAAVTNMALADWEALFFLSVIATFIALIFWNYGAGLLPSSAVGASLYLVPVLAVIAGWAVLGEHISFTTILAGALILGGVAVAEFGKSFLPARKIS